MRKLMTMMLGLCVTSIAGAVNDPDTTGRAVKYLDTMNSAIISYYTPTSQCFQFSASAPPPLTPITCVPVSIVNVGSQPLPVTSVGEIVVAANETRSLLALNLQPVADYSFTNTGTVRSTLLLSVQVKISVESSALSDPSLINPRTGQPFNGKIEGTYQWIFDQRSTEPGAGFGVATRLPFEPIVLTRKGLTSSLGLSATRAALVFARPMTVKVSLTGYLVGTGRANFHMNGRLMGD